MGRLGHALVCLLVAAGCAADSSAAPDTAASPEEAATSAEAEPESTPASPTEAEPESTPASPAEAEPETTRPTDTGPSDTLARMFPQVLSATATRTEDGSWTISATLSSPYDSPERYADAWRVLSPDGQELGVRILTHHHANEQPFTRSLVGVRIPEGVDQLIVEGRDLVNGWGGKRATVTLTP